MSMNYRVSVEGGPNNRTVVAEGNYSQPLKVLVAELVNKPMLGWTYRTVIVEVLGSFTAREIARYEVADYWGYPLQLDMMEFQHKCKRCGCKGLALELEHCQECMEELAWENR